MITAVLLGLAAFLLFAAWLMIFEAKGPLPPRGSFRLSLIHAVANWCVWRGRFRAIPHQGKPYLDRYAISGWLPKDGYGSRRWLPSLYLHHFRDFDRDPAPHSHPWPWALSLILSGSYFEIRLGLASRWVRTFHFNLLLGSAFHRIEQLQPEPGEDGVWTLFLAGRKRKKATPGEPGWGFIEGRFIPWREREVNGVKTSARADGDSP